MQVSFIIPLYNCLAHTRACLRTLQATLPPGLAHEIVLVDDASTDGTRDWLHTLDSPSGGAPIRVLLNDSNLGFARTCNRGAAAAAGEFLFFLNNDLEFPPGWFAPLLATVRDPRTGLAGNLQLHAATGAVDHTGHVFDQRGKPRHDTSRPLLARLTGRRNVAALTGACFAIRRNLWQSLGGFDEGFVNGGEDIDLCLRALARGLRNRVALRSVVRHHVSQSPGRKLRDEHNSRRLAAKWHDTLVRLSLPAMCEALLAVAWAEPRNYPDPALARDAFLYRWRLLPFATSALRAAGAAILSVENARWDHLLDGRPPRRTEDLAWQLFPARFDYPPVL